MFAEESMVFITLASDLYTFMSHNIGLNIVLKMVH